MTETLIDIEGLDDVEQMLNDSTRNITGVGMLKGLQAAAAVVVAELKPRTPLHDAGLYPQAFLPGGGSSEERAPGTLRNALMTDIELDSRSRGGSVDIGFGDQGHVANWVEYGHVLKVHGKAVGFVPAHPFMRPSADATADVSIEVFRDTLLESLANDSKVNTEEAA